MTIVQVQETVDLMGCWMLALDGLEATQSPESTAIPAVAILVGILKEGQVQSLEAGINVFLPKLFSTKSITEQHGGGIELNSQ